MPRTELLRVRPRSAPSLLARVADAVRAYTVGPLTSRSPELARYFGGSGASSAGIAVNEHTIQNFSAVSAAVGLVSDDVSSLPLMLYRRLKDGGKDRFESHSLYRLLHDEPNPEMTTMVWRRTMQTHVMIWGNGYGEIERDRAGRPLAIWPLCPERVHVERNRSGQIQYRYNNDSGVTSTIPSMDMIHLVGRSHDGSVGGSIVERAKESIGLALAAEKFGGTFFGNGATFGGVISFTGPKPPEMSDQNYREQIERRHQGVDRAHKILALYNGAKYEETGVEPDSAQFLETRTFQIREVARWFKIPPHMLADMADATFANVEQMRQEYYTSAIRPWLVLWEQELSRKLISRLERSQQFIEHSVEGFLRGDSAARADFYTKLFALGALTTNEIRGYENLDPLPGGDQSFIQVNNLMPLSSIGAYTDATIEAMKAKNEPAPAPAAPVEENDDDSLEDIRAAVVGLRDAVTEAQSRVAEEAASAASSKALAAQLDEQRQALEAQVESLRAVVVDMEAAIRQKDDEHRGAVETHSAQGQQWTAERQELARVAEAAEAERVRFEGLIATAIREQQNATDAARQHEASARAAEAQAEAAQRSAEQYRAKVEQHRGTPALYRAVYADAMSRMVRRECAKARAYQATPAKLRTWLSTFYDSAEADIFTEAITPGIRLHVAWMGSDAKAEDVARRMVAAHFAESQETLTAICDAGPDGFGELLQRQLTRWERERAESFADALMMEEVAVYGAA